MRITSMSSNMVGAIGQWPQTVDRARRQLAFVPDAGRDFLSFGEQLFAVFRAAISGGAERDPRLVRAPSGAGEVDPSAGGFLVQPDFALGLFARAMDTGDLMKRCTALPIKESANGVRVPSIDETSRANGSRWGGVHSYWAAEGYHVPESHPKFRQIDFDAKKIIVLWRATDELLTDVDAFDNVASQVLSDELRFAVEDAIVEGDGAGKPLGILNGPALITVPKQTGQVAATVVYENVVGMWSSCWAPSRKMAVWLINPEIETSLLGLNQVATPTPVYIPADAVDAPTYGRLLGRPVIPTEYNAAPGSLGDIILADLGEYWLPAKQMQFATSAHVAFLTDESLFRLTWRVSGAPIWSSPLTPLHGSQTKSPFVALAPR